MARTYTIYEALIDGAGAGPAEDGTFTVRFRNEAAGNAFVADKTTYGRKCGPVHERTGCTKAQMDRWSFHG